jgi:hypothetical protein
MNTRHVRAIVSFTILSILAFVLSSWAQTPEILGCYSMDGKTFHRFGESWTETYNGVVYDCKCIRPSGTPVCTPRKQSNSASPGGRDTTTGNQGQSASQSKSGSAIGSRRIKDTQEAFERSKMELLGALKERSLKPQDEIAKARADFERMDPAAIRSEKRLIAQRQEEPNPWCHSLARSLKIKAPPPPPKMFDQLQPGDVLLVGRAKTLTLNVDLWANYYLRLFDKLSSWEWDSRASHTLIYLKEVKGVKLFLDDQLGEGPRIKTEDQVVERYGMRIIDVAQPLSRPDGDTLWGVARELGIKQITADLKKGNNPYNKFTNYGLYGNDNMVCSEASRFVLVEAGLEIAETESLIKKLLGIYFGPANFYSDKQHFLITPLERLSKNNERR